MASRAAYCARCRGRCRELAFTADRYEDDGRGGIRMIRNASILAAIRAGDRVTIANRFGQSRTGRAVMRGPHGWVLNMGGPHGTPDIATDENIVKISPRKNPARRSRGRYRSNPPLGIGLGWWLAIGVGALLVWKQYQSATPATHTAVLPTIVGPTVNGVPVPVIQVPPAPVGSTSVLPTWAIGLPPAGTPSPTTGAPTPLVLVTVSPGGGQPVAVPLNPPAPPATPIPPAVNRPFNPNDPFNTAFGGDYTLPT